MSVIEEFVTALSPKAQGVVKGTAKLVISDHGSVMLSEHGAEENDGEADITFLASADTFRGIMTGKKNPMMAVLSGKLKVEGNQARALKISEILKAS